MAGHPPGVEEEAASEGDEDEDDGEVELELLVLIFVGKPGWTHTHGTGCGVGGPTLTSSHIAVGGTVPAWQCSPEALGSAREAGAERKGG